MDSSNTNVTASMIDALMSSPSSSFWPPLSPANPSPDSALQKRLQAVLNGTHEAWTYAIFWTPSYYDYSGESVLKWGDGIYKGQEADKTRRRRPRRTTMISDEALPMMYDENDVEVSDTEWFYVVSMAASFGSETGLPGKAFATYKPVWVTGSDQILGSGCNRAKQGGASGLRTIVCIPLDNGVLELGSTVEIQQNSDLMNKIRVVFSFEGSRDFSGDPSSNSFPLFSTQLENGGGSSTVTINANRYPNPVNAQTVNFATEEALHSPNRSYPGQMQNDDGELLHAVEDMDGSDHSDIEAISDGPNSHPKASSRVEDCPHTYILPKDHCPNRCGTI